MTKHGWLALALLALTACGPDGNAAYDEATQAVGSEESSTESAGGNGEGRPDPNAVSTTPVLPEGFAGTPTTELTLTPEERAETNRANAANLARNPAGEDPSRRGFPLPPQANGQGGGGQ